MDDNSFDKHIKDKVEGFQDDVIDEGALAGFHSRMNAIPNVPWYSRYKKAIVYTSGVLLISMLNYGIFSLMHNSTPANTSGTANAITNEALEEYKQSYLDLKVDFDALKSIKSRVDTVYIYQTVPANQADLSSSNDAAGGLSGYTHGSTKELSASSGLNRMTKIATTSFYPSEETVSFLIQNKLAYIDHEGAIVLINAESEETPRDKTLKGTAYKELTTSVLPSSKITAIATPKLEEIHVDRGVKLSAKTLNAIEKFKMKGIGFQYGPVLDLFKLTTNDKVGNPGVSAGLMAEFILSPTWRIETGAKYTYAGYKIDDTKDLGEGLAAFPNINTGLGELNQIEQKSHSLSFPVHLKYQHPISEDRAVFLSFGLSPQIYLLQKFEYEYMFPITTDDGVFISEIESPNKVKKNNFYVGTYDFSLGFEKKLYNKSLLQLSAFYSKSAGGLGVESRDLNLIGLRSSIRFRVR